MSPVQLQAVPVPPRQYQHAAQASDLPAFSAEPPGAIPARAADAKQIVRRAKCCLALYLICWWPDATSIGLAQTSGLAEPAQEVDNSPVPELLELGVNNRRVYDLMLARGQWMIAQPDVPDIDELDEQLRRHRDAADIACPDTWRSAEDDLYEGLLCSSLLLADVYDCGKCDNLHVSAAGGVVVSNDGLVLTNHHVVEKKNAGTKGLVAMTHEGVCHPVLEVLSASEADDVALIRLGGDLSRLRPAPIAAEPPSPLTPVFVLSHPHREYFVLTAGRVSRYAADGRRNHRGTRWMEITAEFGAGSSGSGVFNEAGELVGLVSMVVPLIREGDGAQDKEHADEGGDDGTGNELRPRRSRDEDLLEMLLRKCVPVDAIRERFRSEPDANPAGSSDRQRKSLSGSLRGLTPIRGGLTPIRLVFGTNWGLTPSVLRIGV